MTDRKRELRKKEVEFEKGVERIRSRMVYTPAVDIIEKKDYIILLADMPGVDERSVTVTLEKDLLTIRGNVESEVHDGHRLVVSEYGVGDYERTFALSNEIDRRHIKASVKDGVLRLTLPKAESAKTRNIPITGTA